jgi:hypothetical protein
MFERPLRLARSLFSLSAGRSRSGNRQLKFTRELFPRICQMSSTSERIPMSTVPTDPIQQLLAATAQEASAATTLETLHQATEAAVATQAANVQAAANQATTDATNVTNAQQAEQQQFQVWQQANANFQTAVAAVTALYPNVSVTSPTPTPAGQ